MPKEAGRKKGRIDPAYLERAAVHYLERFGSSSENLRRVLLRKVKRRLEPGEPVGEEIVAAIAGVVDRVVASGLVNDQFYAGSKASSLARRGTSTRLIRVRLAAKGVAPELITAAVEESGADDLALARRYAQRRRLGPWRTRPDQAAAAKDLAALCRAGFPYRIASAALNEPADEPA